MRYLLLTITQLQLLKTIETIKHRDFTRTAAC